MGVPAAASMVKSKSILRAGAQHRGMGSSGAIRDGHLVTIPRSLTRTLPKRGELAEVLALIAAARGRAYQAANTELVGLYWQLGELISEKIASAEWGDGVVDDLAATIAREYPGMRGFTRRNLFRMRQFCEAYRGQKKVSPLVTQSPWTHHLIITGQDSPPKEPTARGRRP